METWAYGLTLSAVGMGGTLVTLGLLTLVMDLIKIAFPAPVSPPEEGPS